MQAIVEIGSKQYKVSSDQILYVEKLSHKIGDKVSLEKVLLYTQDGKDPQIGMPYLGNATVEVKILEEAAGPKIRGFKYKRRKGYSRRWGHRQKYHKIQVESIKGT